MMSSVLKEIVKYTRRRVELEKKIIRDLPERSSPVNSLYNAVSKCIEMRKIGMILEYKRASPAGIINLSLSVEEFYRKTRSFVIGYSVLTEPRWFLGSYIFLRELRELDSHVPILMKDFIVDPWQIELAYSLGADVVLLIVKVLGLKMLDDYVSYARKLGLDVIIEVDNLEDAKVVSDCYSSTRGVILGVNSRDLTTLQVDVERACKIAEEVNFSGPIIIESGIKSRRDIELIRRVSKVGGVLIGTSIMRNIDLVGELYAAATE